MLLRWSVFVLITYTVLRGSNQPQKESGVAAWARLSTAWSCFRFPGQAPSLAASSRWR